ncbi:MAG: glycosyltransferase family 2 protein [Myxococcota bacterium]|nr:glycosyltransferase family 2 protein [Myxococcota bacterium]
MPDETQPPPELSVVVLCYWAEDWVPLFAEQLVRELEEAGIDYELILVANYLAAESAHDRTPEIGRRFAESNARVRALTLPKQGMMGWDMRTGLEAARGAHLAVIDGDGQMPASDIVRVYRMLRAGGYDLVKTFRSRRFDGVYRATLSRCYNLLFRLLFPSEARVRDINSKPKVMTRAAYESMTLRSNDWFTDAEIVIEALRNELKIGEVSTVFLKNERRATLVPPAAIWEFLVNLFQYRFGRRSARSTATAAESRAGNES